MKKTITLLTALLLIGCGSRKSSVTKLEEKKTETIQKVETDNSIIKTETITDTKTDEVTEIETIEPIDNTKPFIVDGKSYTNTKVVKSKTKRLNTDNSKVNTNVVNDKNKSENKRTQSVVVKKDKVTDRTMSLWWLLWFLLLIPIWFGYKELKKHNVI